MERSSEICEEVLDVCRIGPTELDREKFRLYRGTIINIFSVVFKQSQAIMKQENIRLLQSANKDSNKSNLHHLIQNYSPSYGS